MGMSWEVYGWGHVNFEVFRAVCVYEDICEAAGNMEVQRRSELFRNMDLEDMDPWGKMRFREMEALETVVKWAITA